MITRKVTKKGADRTSQTLSAARIDRCKDCPARPKSAFAHLGENSLTAIDELRHLVQFEPNMALPLEFDGHAGFYCLRSGHAKVSQNVGNQSRSVRISGSGDLIAYGNLHSPGGLTCTSIDAGAACFFSHASFSSFQGEAADISDGIIKSLCRVIAIKDRRIFGLENHSVKARIASELLSLERKFGEVSTLGNLIRVRIDRSTLAELSGTVVESVARALTEFEDSHFIKRVGWQIHILDRHGLQSTALKG